MNPSSKMFQKQYSNSAFTKLKIAHSNFLTDATFINDYFHLKYIQNIKGQGGGHCPQPQKAFSGQQDKVNERNRLDVHNREWWRP